MINAACPNCMCKSHCISTGGCFSHGFPSTPVPSAHAPPPPSQPPPSAHLLPQPLPSAHLLPPYWSATSTDVLDDFLYRMAPADLSSGFDEYYYQSDVDREEQDLQLEAAVVQSIADLQQPPPPAQTQDLQLEAALARSIANLQPLPVAQAQTTTTKSKKGKTQAAPGGMISEARRALDPRLSTQLNNSWLATHNRHELLKTNFQQRAEVKKAHEQCLKGCFLVNCWHQNGIEPVSVTVYKHSTIESAEMKEQYRCLEDRFQAVFHLPFTASTYHDAKKHWLRASEEGLLEDAEAAGCTDAGHWSKLAARVPLK
ncbi:hypothetical protein BDR03DRAFT_1013798 [Suillus americanus]|nr:hypothetical protein BDR03DRAFT_1013798 [Suillus americanus]